MDSAAEPGSGVSVYSTMWVWEIRHPSGRVKDKGTFRGWRHAAPAAVADEQMALLVADVAPRYYLVRRLVCRAWRQDTPDDFGESRGEDWYATHERGRRRRREPLRRVGNPWPPEVRTPIDAWI